MDDKQGIDLGKIVSSKLVLAGCGGCKFKVEGLNECEWLVPPPESELRRVVTSSSSAGSWG
jgi:hypothetical protein